MRLVMSRGTATTTMSRRSTTRGADEADGGRSSGNRAARRAGRRRDAPSPRASPSRRASPSSPTTTNGRMGWNGGWRMDGAGSAARRPSERAAPGFPRARAPRDRASSRHRLRVSPPTTSAVPPATVLARRGGRRASEWRSQRQNRVSRSPLRQSMEGRSVAPCRPTVYIIPEKCIGSESTEIL